nr:cell wall hydrolase [Hoeflea prorocentri]
MFASILTWMCLTMALSLPAHAASALMFNMTMASPKMLMVSPQSPLSATADAEGFCLALAIYHEARGEPDPGQYAVSITVLNRVRSGAYPDSICDVVYQNAERLNRCQFSFACDRLSDFPGNLEAFAKARRIAEFTNGVQPLLDNEAVLGSPFATVGVMTHYHRFDVRPVWSRKLKRLGQVGDHIFFKSDRVVKRYRKIKKPVPAELAAFGGPGPVYPAVADKPSS